VNRLVAIAALGLIALAAPARAAAPASARLEVDLVDAPRGFVHVVEMLDAAPGPLTLAYPEWIPGEHAPDAPIADLAGLVFEARMAGGTTRVLPWTRDALDLYAFTVVLPEGATGLTARFDRLSVESNGAYVDGPVATPNLAILEWNEVVLVPAGARADRFQVEAGLRLPAGWKSASALEPASVRGDSLAFGTVSLERLVDSPLACGRHTREIALAPEVRPRHRAFLVADSEAALAAPSELIASWEKLVRESRALFGASHYRSYTFLIVLSDGIESFGLEHHESSDNRLPERALIEAPGRAASATLLPHEFVHSWNGKYRRPDGLTTPDYATPMRMPLLWIYEGLTEYYGWVLAGRAGLESPRDSRDDLAENGAAFAHRAGRRWRPLVDTAVASSILQTSPPAFDSWRRSLDYYGEAALVWLEADTRIRAATKGRRSLDDFCRDFFGGADGPPAVVPYTLTEVVHGLDEVAPGDWASFFATRVDSVRTEPPLAGIEAAGWSVAYADSVNPLMELVDSERERSDYRYSLGFRVSRGGTIPDVLPDSPAARAGMAPGMKLIAVDGRLWSREALDDALAATRPAESDPAKAADAGPRGRTSLELLAAQGDFVRAYRLEGLDGPRFATLRRRPGTPDVLAGILAPLAGPRPRR
jgi:predicted metalloprotease with PDZ domain